MKPGRWRVAGVEGASPRRPGAGRPASLRPVSDVASCLDGPSDGRRGEPLEGSLVEDFADFLAAGLDETGASSAGDPQFRERLRRRLWRLHVLVRRPEPDRTH